jgi:hypothetical protein
MKRTLRCIWRLLWWENLFSPPPPFSWVGGSSWLGAYRDISITKTDWVMEGTSGHTARAEMYWTAGTMYLGHSGVDGYYLIIYNSLSTYPSHRSHTLLPSMIRSTQSMWCFMQCCSGFINAGNFRCSWQQGTPAYLVTRILCYLSHIGCHTKPIQIFWEV